MIKTTSKLIPAMLAALLTAACGSNEDDASTTTTPAVSPAPVATPGGLTADSAPTAVLAAGGADAATALATEVQNAAEVAAQVGRFAGAGALPTGTTVTYNCAQFLGSGATGTVAYSYPDTPPSAGWKTTFTLDDCAYASGAYAFAVNGTVWYEYLRYVSGSDFAFRGTTQDLAYTYAYNGTTVRSGTYSFVHYFDIHDGVITTSSATADAIIAGLQLSRSGTNVILNARYVTNLDLAGGVVRIDLTNWTYDLSTGRPGGGTAAIVGANGTRVDVVATATSCTVTYTAADGNKTIYTVSVRS
jgi:hypothetical protein